MFMLGLTLTICTLLILLYKRFSLEKITFLLLVLHVLIGLLLQFLGIFTNITVVIVYLITVCTFLFVMHRHNKKPQKSTQKINIVHIITGFSICIVAAMALLSVHYNYNGLVSTITGAEYAVNVSYPYPQFSDEWVAVEVIDQTIQEQKIPTSDVFFGKPLFNFLFGFHSFLAELHVFFAVNPLYAYVYFSVFVSVLAVLLTWRLLSVVGISQPIAVAISLLLLYVTNGSNLPGLWYLLPWNVGFIFLLLTYIFLVKKQYSFAAGSVILGLYMYPPMLVFFLFLILGFFMNRSHLLKLMSVLKNKKVYRTMLATCALIAIVIVLSTSVRDIISLAIQFIIRPLNSVGGVAPIFHVWTIVPVIACIGFLFAFQKKNREQFSFLLYPAVGGCVLWVIYWIGFSTIIIDYHRVVSITGLHIVIVSAIGLQVIVQYILSSTDMDKSLHKHESALVACVICIFLVMNIGYTNRNNWALLEKRVWDLETYAYEIIKPRPPVNTYLHEDDMQLFSQYEGKRFLAPSWKALVIGAATKNIPLETKPATFTVREFYLEQFMDMSCEERIEAAETYTIDLVYTSEFTCEQFKYVGESEEGGFLYEFQR